MVSNMRWRFTVIALIVGFLGWKAYDGIVNHQLELGIDLKGGSELIFKFDFARTAERDRATVRNEALNIIQERVDRYGLKDLVIQPIGADRFSVQVSAKDKKQVDAIKELVTQLGKLEFRITVEPDTENYDFYWKLFQGKLAKGIQLRDAREIPPNELKTDGERSDYPSGLRWYELSDRAKNPQKSSLLRRGPKNDQDEPQPWILCKLDTYDISGDALKNVRHGPDTGSGLSSGWAVYFRVEKMFQQRMGNLTRHEPNKFMAIILNDRVGSAPILNSTLSSSGQISGSFDEEEARQLAAVLQAGALQDRPEMISERTIAAELAGNARRASIMSTLLGFAVVLVVMIYLYYGPGLLANLALLLNLVLLVGVLTWFEAVLTLPGIAGVVLTVGMAVDANILVFERIKEEKAKGRTLSQAVSTGYDRALVTIVDSNLTTLITAYFLFQIGSGPVRGFGITLAIGIVASMFTALYVTRTCFAWFLKRGTVTEARMRGGFAPPSIGWNAMSHKAVTISAIAMVAGIVLWEAVPEKKKYDLDFTKGSKLIVRFHEEVAVDLVHERLDGLAKTNPLYRDVAVRITAEGIGKTVGTDASRGYELRSQNIATEQEIKGFRTALQRVFKAELVPARLETTIREGPTGTAIGEISFDNADIPVPLVQQALKQFNVATGRLGGAKVEKIKARGGAGSSFRFSFTESADDHAQIALNVRAALSQFNVDDARKALLEITKKTTITPSAVQAAKDTLASLEGLDQAKLSVAGFYDEPDPFPLADRIDPSTAQEHRDAAVRAIALSILGIILYVAFRFRSWSFGFAAVVALIHDVVIVLGVVALVNWLGIVDARLNLVTVAAFLTLIGYSINDTIVVFDRIRENRGTGKSRLPEIIDKSINQTLSRTIRTTATTWVVVVVLFVMNLGTSSSLVGFAFILTVGVLVGTYSSIFIACPTLLYLPWLWDKCGGSGKALFKKCVPFWVGSSALLIVVAVMQGTLDFGADFSLPLFNSLLLGLPVGVLAMFLLNFVRFVNLGDARKTAGTA